jgi:hypothetical protein
MVNEALPRAAKWTGSLARRSLEISSRKGNAPAGEESAGAERGVMLEVRDAFGEKYRHSI